MDRGDFADRIAEEIRDELATYQALAAASRDALRLLRALTADEDGPWRPEIVSLEQALANAGEHA